jgi:hypothetical protein
MKEEVLLVVFVTQVQSYYFELASFSKDLND